MFVTLIYRWISYPQLSLMWLCVILWEGGNKDSILLSMARFLNLTDIFWYTKVIWYIPSPIIPAMSVCDLIRGRYKDSILYLWQDFSNQHIFFDIPKSFDRLIPNYPCCGCVILWGGGNKDSILPFMARFLNSTHFFSDIPKSFDRLQYWISQPQLSLCYGCV